MDYRGIFLYENSSVFRAEEFIFMVNFDEIEFLESEIVDDDPTAPVGTLVHITEDGKVEPVEQKQDVQAVESDVQNETRQGEAKEVVEVGNSDNEQNEIAQTVTTDVQDEPQAEQTAQPEETVTETSQPEAVEQAEEVEDTTDAQTEEVADESTETVETANEDIDETAIETTEETQEVAPQAEIVEEAQNIEDTSKETAPVEDNAAVETAVVEESAQESQNVEEAQDEQPEEQKPVQKAKKPRKPAQKKETAPVAPVVNDDEHKTSLNLKNGKSVNDELFGTSFEMEQPAKAKIVSTKKKQEKAEDLWAVAAVANPKKETAPVKEEAKEESKPVKTVAKKATTKNAESEPKAEKVASKTGKTAPKAENEDVKPAPKKTASKKSTKVENINTSTEEKKVAKTTKEVAAEEKPVKASKATKEAPVKEAPAKEEKAHKAETKTVKDEETVIVEGEGKTHGKYVIKKTDKGNFVFKLYSSNYRVVAIGAQAYTTLGAAKIGIQSIINNAEKAPVENQTLKNYEVEKFPKWEIYQDKKGEYRLRLFATNGNLIATTNDGYADITGAKNGIAAVARANKGCAIVRNDNLW